ncbi:hypothetical protein ACFSTC_28400 [Nonomuraea ferruginea]
MLIGGALVAAGGLSLLALPLVSGVAGPMALLMLGYGLVTSIYAVANPTLAQIVPAAQRTSVLTIGLALSGLLSVVGPWLAGVVLDAAKASGGRGRRISRRVHDGGRHRHRRRRALRAAGQPRAGRVEGGGGPRRARRAQRRVTAGSPAVRAGCRASAMPA